MIENIINDIMSNPYEFIFWTTLFCVAFYFFFKVIKIKGDENGKTNDPFKY
tara:strand:- start:9654 stop:9806 length:153 start_codon:yes stop_codon:yes gene_type:complete